MGTLQCFKWHHSDVIMSVMASQITSVFVVYLAVCSGADQRKHQSSVSLAFVRGSHRWPVNSPHKRPVTRKMSPFDDVIMNNFRAHHSSRIYIISYVKGIIGKDFANIKCPETYFHHNFNSQFKSDDDDTFPQLHIFCRNACNAFTVIPKLQLYPWW